MSARSTARGPEVAGQGVCPGAIVLEEQTTLAAFNRQTGVRHGMFMTFVSFPGVVEPKSPEDGKLSRFLVACREVRAVPVVTVECFQGLDSYKTDQVARFAERVRRESWTPPIVRWNHEMNGSWYPWGQQPGKYIERFRAFAEILRREAPDAAMAWTPNQGWGYPWPGCKFANAHLESGDPYAPYYPGDDVVDWVGISYYHWGETRGANEVPPHGKWGSALGFGNPVGNFHDLYAVQHGKPTMVAETSALYDLGDTKKGGAPEAAIKCGWIRQVYNTTDESQPRLDRDLPHLKAIFWFSILKHEEEVGGMVDWRVSSNPAVVECYRTAVSAAAEINGLPSEAQAKRRA